MGGYKPQVISSYKRERLLLIALLPLEPFLNLLARKTVLGIRRRARLDQVIDCVSELIFKALRYPINRRLLLLVHEDGYP
jgi:hypothetical protein